MVAGHKEAILERSTERINELQRKVQQGKMSADHARTMGLMIVLETQSKLDDIKDTIDPDAKLKRRQKQEQSHHARGLE